MILVGWYVDGVISDVIMLTCLNESNLGMRCEQRLREPASWNGMIFR